MRPRRRLLLLLTATALVGLGASAAPAAPAQGSAAAVHQHPNLPATIQLPEGFQPEGIAISRDGTFYVGSIPTGAVFRGDVRSGVGEVFVDGRQGRAAIGLKVDARGRLFVAGGPTGQAFVYDARSGTPLASYQLASGASFVNDVVVTRTAAWFTDSLSPVLYRVPLGRHGELPTQQEVTTLPLSGDFQQQPGFNANGIDDARGGHVLVIVQTNTGLLFTVDPRSGLTRRIDLGGETVVNGDGILLHGSTLFVVQNLDNQVTRIRLRGDLATGSVVERISDPDFDVPTTIASFLGNLYVVNARFTTTPTPTTPYSVVRVDGR
jgi:outer membrane protein assembly factor BamB